MADAGQNGSGTLQWGRGYTPFHSAGDTHRMVASMMRLIAAAPFALPVVKALVLHEQVSTIPSGWSFTSAPQNDTQIVLQVALAQQNIDQLESRLSSISTPGSSSYGQYLDTGDINALFGPSDASKNAVKAWLSSSGINTYTVQGDSVWLKPIVSSEQLSTSTQMLRECRRYVPRNTPSRKTSRLTLTWYLQRLTLVPLNP